MNEIIKHNRKIISLRSKLDKLFLKHLGRELKDDVWRLVDELIDEECEIEKFANM